MGPKRVCIIGSGPCGMSLLLHLHRLKESRKVDLEITCYEKQKDWGGLWNYTWRTGTDEFGEPIHGSQYEALWANGPKEAFELPDYLCDDHFGQELPSFIPREAVFDYLQGRWKAENLKKSITFGHAVRSVTHDPQKDEFTVAVENLQGKHVLPPQHFDYICVASGHYSTPNFPEYPGIETFPGRVLHSHEFRNSLEFSGQKVLLVGSSYSGEDIAAQAIKFGAKEAIVCYRSVPTGLPWPKNIIEKPLLTHIERKTIHFSDNTQIDEVDSIIFCTGYIGHFPFMQDSLRHRSANSFYPPDLYKGVLYTSGGNDKVLYLGRQDVAYTFTMFDVQAFWSAKYILGDILLPEPEEMEKDWKSWFQRCMKAMEARDIPACIQFQGDYIQDMADQSGYPHKVTHKILDEWVENRLKSGVCGYRNYSHTSIFTQRLGIKPKIEYMENMNHDLKSFLKLYSC